MGDFFDEHIIETTSLEDISRTHVVHPIGGYRSISENSVPYTLTFSDYDGVRRAINNYTDTVINLNKMGLNIGRTYEEIMKSLGKEEETKVDVRSIKGNGTHTVYCNNKTDLASKTILLALSALKSRLIYDISPNYVVLGMECRMTPMVKNQLVEASKRLRRYGKKSPIIPNFDEYGNRLPDNIEIDGDKGITVNIVSPEKYGELYLELTATEIPSGVSTTEWNTVGSSSWETFGDLPF